MNKTERNKTLSLDLSNWINIWQLCSETKMWGYFAKYRVKYEKKGPQLRKINIFFTAGVGENRSHWTYGIELYWKTTKSYNEESYVNNQA